MPEFFIEDESDLRLDPFRNLIKPRQERELGTFIAEGWFVVERLLQSRFEVRSILVSRNHLPRVRQLASQDEVVLIVADSISTGLVGFKFHRGVMACGVRGSAPSQDALLNFSQQRATWVVCPETTDPDNLGQLIRLSAAFGIDGMIIGTQCADPLSRRCLRLSMGNAFSLPVVRTPSVHKLCLNLKRDHQFELVASAINAPNLLRDQKSRSDRIALLFGNEGSGLSPEFFEICDRKLAIEMCGRVDSINVASAAAIFLHHFTSMD